MLFYLRLNRRLRNLVSKTHMEYTSRGYLDKNAVSFFSNTVDVLGETQVYRYGVTPPSLLVPAQTPIPPSDEDHVSGVVHQLSFDSHNDRLLEAWLLKQIQDKTTVPIILWSFNGPHGDDKNAVSSPLLKSPCQVLISGPRMAAAGGKASGYGGICGCN